jgi:glycerate-2-kinase
MLVDPCPGVSLDDLIQTIRSLSERGASIIELNAVRAATDDAKQGGLLRGCRAKNCTTFILSDIVGDPVNWIGGGPTVYGGDGVDWDLARRVIQEHFPNGTDLPPSIGRRLENRVVDGNEEFPFRSAHVLVGNCQTAIDGAGNAASALGYKVTTRIETETLDVNESGRRMYRQLLDLQPGECVIDAGEPVVSIPSGMAPGAGGRNLHLVLSALESAREFPAERCLLSAGTDGQDGNTEAAGAWLDSAVAFRARESGLHAKDYLARFDSWNFFHKTGSLITTGPTGTNVSDLRILLATRVDSL